MTKRSIGLTILGWFEIVMGFLGSGFFLFWLVYFLGYVMSYNGGIQKILWVFVFFLPPMIMLVCLIFFGIGILKLKKWAWNLNIFLYPFMHIYIYIPGLWIPKQWRIPLFVYFVEKISIAWWAVPILIVFYLTRSKVKAQFFK